MQLPRRGSLFWTLSASLLAMLLLAVLLQWLVAVLLVEPGLRRWHEARSELVAVRLAARVGEALDRGDPESVPRLLAQSQREIEPSRLFVLTAAGRWIGAPGVSPGWSRRLDAARLAFERATAPEEEPADPDAPPPRGRGGGAPRFDQVFVASAPVPGPAGRVATVYVAAPQVRFRLFAMLPRHAAVYVPVAVLLAALAGLLISHRLQRRIARLDDLASRIGQGELDARIDAPGTDEIGHLGARLNEMAERLETSRAAVSALERQRGQLLADISHDLVTPLTTIRGFAETLLDASVQSPAETRERYLRSMVQASERMERLLEDLSDLSRLESQSDGLERERLDLAALARNSVERFAAAFSQRGLALRYDSTATEAWVDADGHRMEQVLDNLLGNAMRHLPAGTAGRVEVSVALPDVDPLRVRLVVEDDGPGIDAADLPHVFDRFYRGDRSRSTPGTGLGLAIAREIVQRHGGTIVATPRVPRGVRFTVELPAASRA